MPRVCTVCTHPQRAAIDEQLAYHSCIKTRIAASYGLRETAIRYHEARHLDPRLIAQAKASLDAESLKAVDVIREAVVNLREDMKAVRGVRADQYLEVIDRLIRANEQYAKINRELSADPLTAFFVSVGVAGESEARRRFDLTRTGENQTLEELFEEWKATGRFLLSQKPEWLQAARTALDGASFAQVVETNGNGATNGHG